MCVCVVSHAGMCTYTRNQTPPHQTVDIQLPKTFPAGSVHMKIHSVKLNCVWNSVICDFHSLFHSSLHSPTFHLQFPCMHFYEYPLFPLDYHTSSHHCGHISVCKDAVDTFAHTGALNPPSFCRFFSAAGFCFSVQNQLEVNQRREKEGEMELSITVGAPQEGGDSRPIDRFAFEGLSCRTCVCVCTRM